VVTGTEVDAGVGRGAGAVAGADVTAALFGVSVRSSAAAGTVEFTVEVIGAEPATIVPVTSLLIELIGL
jgi:hypothetical protein